MFRDVTRDAYQQLVNSLLHWQRGLLGNVQTAMASGKTTDPYRFFAGNPEARAVIGTLFVNKGADYVLRDDAEAVMQAQAVRAATELQEQFVGKNTAKMASIVTAKGNLDTCAVISRTVSFVSLSGAFRFTFKDGSAFTAHNSAVRSYSKYNRPFYRFPTTFHDVMLPGGEPMKGVSEKSMNEVFAKASDGIKIPSGVNHRSRAWTRNDG
jgi:hypothetical protein